MPSRPANLTAADTAAEQGNAAATVTGVAADSVELATGPVNPTAAVPLAEQGSPDRPELPLDTFAAVSAQATVVASLFHLEPYFTLNSREI